MMVCNPHSDKFDNRRMSITLLNSYPRDHVGERSGLEVIDDGDELMDLLKFDSDDAMFLAADGGVVPIESEEFGVVIVKKRYLFEYTIKRE